MPQQHLYAGDLLLSPDHLPLLGESLMQVQRLIEGFAAQASAAASADFWDDPAYSWVRPYQVVDGTLYIPVKGMLLHDFPYQFMSWATGYEYITAAVERGLADSNVRRIVLVVNSGGGYVSGCFDCADVIFNGRSIKPIVAVAHEMALSAAYALACSAETVVVARTGLVGSIGVLLTHVDVSNWLESMGVKYEFIFAGAKKADVRSEKPLEDDGRARLQSIVDSSYQIFVSTVARNRGLSEEAVRATEADFYPAAESIERGLADQIASLGEILSADADEPEQGDEPMPPVTPEATNPTPDLLAAARADGVRAGATAERQRIAEVLGTEEAKAHPAQALHVALTTDWTAAQSQAFLKTLPTAEATPAPAANPAPAAPKAKSAFEIAMETGNPDVGAGAAPTPAGGSRANAIFASAGIAPVRPTI